MCLKVCSLSQEGEIRYDHDMSLGRAVQYANQRVDMTASETRGEEGKEEGQLLPEKNDISMGHALGAEVSMANNGPPRVCPGYGRQAALGIVQRARQETNRTGIRHTARQGHGPVAGKVPRILDNNAGHRQSQAITRQDLLGRGVPLCLERDRGRMVCCPAAP